MMLLASYVYSSMVVKGETVKCLELALSTANTAIFGAGAVQRSIIEYLISGDKAAPRICKRIIVAAAKLSWASRCVRLCNTQLTQGPYPLGRLR
jgi:hypothetical protein